MFVPDRYVPAQRARRTEASASLNATRSFACQAVVKGSSLRERRRSSGSIADHVTRLDGQIEAVAAEVRQLIKIDPTSSRNLTRLRGSTGVGEVSATIVLAELPNRSRPAARDAALTVRRCPASSAPPTSTATRPRVGPVNEQANGTSRAASNSEAGHEDEGMAERSEADQTGPATSRSAPLRPTRAREKAQTQAQDPARCCRGQGVMAVRPLATMPAAGCGENE